MKSDDSNDSKGLPRSFELVVSLLGLVLLFPLIAVSAAMIALTSPGGVMFRQKRVGRHGEVFVLYKLRTMSVANRGPLVTSRDDARITPVGQFLRQTKLDELPTLWNVLKGDMALVGPRPEVSRYVRLEDSMWQAVLRVKPGITDPVTLQLRSEEVLLAQITGDRETYYVSELLPIKLKGYLAYIKCRSWRTDLKVLIQTVGVVVNPSLSNALLKKQGLGTSRRNLFLPLRRHWLYSMQTMLDLSVLASAFAFAYLLRFDFEMPGNEISNFFVQAPFVVLLQFVVLSVSGARGGIWRYTGMGHIKSFLYSALASLVVLTLLRLELPSAYQAWRVPLSVNLIDAMLAFGGVFGLRILRRELYEHTKRRKQTNENGNGNGNGKVKKLVLLIGAGQAGALAAKEIEGRGDLDFEIRGFIDDDRMKLGRSVGQRHRVLGTTEDLPRLVRSLGIDHVVITIAQASRQSIHRIVKICEQIPIKVRIIPGLYEILDGRVRINRIRDVRIADLLGRESVQLDIESISKALAGKTVMVTGAGGSIGSELARQVQRFAPANLLLVDRAEFALFDIDLELRHSSLGVSIVPLVGDVGDESRIRGIFEAYRPHVVIHAAAHKHVPLMELNPIEAVKNNVMNSRLLAELAGEYCSEVFVLVSTDKAVRPESMMGASKRAAELVIQDLKNSYDTRYVAVRFGNVIGSAGSVIPIFRKQIRDGGPVTITDRRMKRYFMTIPEAAQLVLQTSTLAKGGEVFILHMGEPVRIMDLAETLITLSGLKPHEDIKIVETGIRPGEKLYEELSFDSEETVATSHPKIFINKLATLETETVRQALLRLSELIRYGDAPQLRTFLNDLIPEAHLNGNGLETSVARGLGGVRAVGRSA